MFKNWFFWVVILIVLAGGVFIYREAAKPRGPVTAPGETIADAGRGHVTDISQIKYNSNPPTSGDHFPVWLKAGVYKAPVSDGYQIHSLEHGYIVISYDCTKSISNSQFLISKAYAAENTATASAQVSDIMTKMQTPPSGSSTFKPDNAPYDTTALADSFQSEQCKKLVKDITNFSGNYTRVIIIPRPNMDRAIALTAWNHILYQDKWNSDEAKKFADALENQGPEKTME